MRETTFAREFLPDEAQCPTFVNADLIAAGLSPFRPEAAAMRARRLMIELLDPTGSGASRAGRHDVREDAIRRRFAAGRMSFEALYKPIADAWALYDSSQPEPVLLDWAEKQ